MHQVINQLGKKLFEDASSVILYSCVHLFPNGSCVNFIARRPLKICHFFHARQR